MQTPLVYIIIVTYNAREEVVRCLQSLRGLHYPNHRVLVVDNGSGDGTEEAVRAGFPDVGVLQTGENTGYTGGNNAGIRHALAAGADHVLILNPDTELVNPTFVDEMVARMQRDPKLGIAGPRVFGPTASVTQNTVLFTPGIWRNVKHWVRYRINPQFAHLSLDREVDAEVLNGVCLMVRASCLLEIGLFDRHIFMYVEDVDMDYRAQQHGWGVRYLPIDSVVHRRRSGDCGATSMVNFFLKRNIVYFLRKVGRPVDAWIYAIVSIALIGVAAAQPFPRTRARESRRFLRRLLAAYLEILKGTPYGQRFGPPHGCLRS
jgi:GT2 family glycosyltransferase